MNALSTTLNLNYYYFGDSLVSIYFAFVKKMGRFQPVLPKKYSPDYFDIKF